MAILSTEFFTTVVLPEEFQRDIDRAHDDPTPYPGAILLWIEPSGSMAGLEAFSAGGKSVDVPENDWYLMQAYVGDKAVETFRERYPDLREQNLLRLF